MSQQNVKKIYEKRLSKNKNLPKCQQIEHVKHTQTIKKNYPYKNTTIPLLKQTIGTCPECTSQTYVIDYHRGEKVCPECGYVLNNTVYAVQYHLKDALKYSIKSLTQTERNQLRHKNKHILTDAKEWRQQQINREIDVISTQLELNIWQKKRIMEIIKKTGLKKLHSREDITTIIIAVARYILKRTTHNIVLLRYDREPFNNLTPKVYNTVEKNIKKHYYHLDGE